jgi:hypothetical protein
MFMSVANTVMSFCRWWYYADSTRLLEPTKQAVLDELAFQQNEMGLKPNLDEAPTERSLGLCLLQHQQMDA